MMGKIQVGPVFYEDINQNGAPQNIHKRDQYTPPNPENDLPPDRAWKTKKEAHIQHHQFQSITCVCHPEGLHPAATNIDTGAVVDYTILHIIIPHLDRRKSGVGRE